jgi:FMN phosphatase YigB (HAD superfamily)
LVVESKGGSSGQADKLTEIFFQIRTLYSQFPDTMPCLSELMRRGYRLAILTNYPLGDAETAFRYVGLDPAWFDAIVNAYPDRKPSPLVYRRILDALHIAAGECLFVDDEPDNVRSATAVGMHAVLSMDQPTAGHPLRYRLGESTGYRTCTERTGCTTMTDSRVLH